MGSGHILITGGAGYVGSLLAGVMLNNGWRVTVLDKLMFGRGEIFNLGSDDGNYTKDEIVAFVQKHLPETTVRHVDLSFGGDMRDIVVSFAKVRERLGFQTKRTVEDGVIEVRDALTTGLLKDPSDARYRNAQFIVQ